MKNFHTSFLSSFIFFVGSAMSVAGEEGFVENRTLKMHEIYHNLKQFKGDSVMYPSNGGFSPYKVSDADGVDMPYAGRTSSVTANTYYVDDTAGNDDNDGLSPDNAWKSLGKVNGNQFGPGDSILFKRGGQWTGHLFLSDLTGTESHRITIGAYGTGSNPKLTGLPDIIPTVTLQNPRNVTFEEFEVSHPAASLPSQSSLRGIYVHATSEGIYPNITIRKNYIHDVEGQPITNRHMQAGIFMRSENAGARFENVLIEDNKLERCSSRGILYGGGRNESYEYYDKNVVIRGNEVSYTALEGILISNAENVMVEHNKVFHAGGYTAPGRITGVTAGLWGRAKDITIQYNEVAYTRLTEVDFITMDSEAFDIDADSPGYQIIQYNYSHDNEGGFFLSMGDMGPDFTYGIIRYNISRNDGHSTNDYRVFELHGHVNGRLIPIYIYNNTFCNDYKISVQKRSPGAIMPGIEFRNNIFYAPVLQFDDPGHIVYDHNHYHSGSAAINDMNAILGDPLFNSPGTVGDGIGTVTGYQLPGRSPAVDAGMIIQNNGSKDFFGNTVTATEKPTIGAFQSN